MSALCQLEKENKQQLSTMIFSKKYQSKKCQEVKSQELLKVYYFVKKIFKSFYSELFQRAIDNELTPKSSPKMKRRKSVDSKINQQIDVLVSGGFDLKNC